MSDRAALDPLRKDRAALENALKDAGATVNGTSLRCPWHNDENPSGSIYQGDDRVWRFSCKASCGWNKGKHHGDVVDVVRKVQSCDYLTALAHLGLNGQGQPESPTSTTASRKKVSKAAPPVDPAALADEASRRLLGDEDLLETLWQTRAVDRATAEQFGVGVSKDQKFWTFPLVQNGHVVAVKNHRINPGVTPKCYWTPRGTNSRRLFPVCLDHPGAVWVCPGELKALAVIAAGRSAVGITGGEGVDLPDEIVELLAERAVAVAPDDDAGGEKWLAEKVCLKLEPAGIEVREADLGLNTAAGVNDIGDFIVSLAQDDKDAPAIAATLDHAFEQADLWRRFRLGEILESTTTWQPVEHIATGLTDFDTACGGGLRTRGVHILAAKPKRAKTQVGVQIAVNIASAGTPVGFVSLEMSRDEIGRLIVAQRAKVSRARLDRGGLTLDEFNRSQAAKVELKDIPLIILDDDHYKTGLNRDQFADLVADGVRRAGWRFVVLDYMGLLTPLEGESDLRTDILNSAVLRRVARRENIALLVIADLRKSASDPPTLEDVRGAGRVAYDAINVWVLDSTQGTPVSRQPTGVVRLYPRATRFSGASHTDEVVELRWEPGFGSVCDSEGR